MGEDMLLSLLDDATWERFAEALWDASPKRIDPPPPPLPNRSGDNEWTHYE
jgi:hypothetical protein